MEQLGIAIMIWFNEQNVATVDLILVLPILDPEC